MVYAYAVCAPPGAEAPGCGLHEQPLRAIVAGGLAAVVSDVAARPAPEEDALWTHEHVVERLMGRGPVLPMRFGSMLDDDHAVADLLRARAPELAQGLDRVRGAIELGVRAVWCGDETAPEGGDHPASGAAYLHGLVHRRRRADHLAQRIDGPLRALARASRRRLLVTPNLPLSAAYLVTRENLDAFRARAVALDEEIGQAQIICTGPWPPYSFVGAEETRR